MSIQATHHSTTATPDLLRTSLRVDSWATAAFGAVMLAGATWLRDPLGLPVALSVVLGIVMLAGGAVLALIARYPRIPVGAAAAVVVVNSLSCLGMVALACTDVVALTGFGRAFMVVGAVAVAVFGELEFVGLRRARRMSGRPA
ncbi:hypothetical protein [Streptomyces sparsogenes]|uniref:Integral membrane protein n=1 Tax=Streptomyces sparsogenes DSM 40356 TaxID=1331668 RepID=A0A1R1SPT1_9ACTN|nr:hypothetical protein [Streptomyces sparsogenes]OMI40301.1 hypothetical protein SPAR_06985 [Streptomyces sparsogenes DSM 40356]